MTRTERLLNGATPTTRIVEIGPGYNPVAPKRAGWTTHVVDHAPREELVRKYTGAGVDLDAFETVDTVWADGELHAAVGTALEGTFDLLIASHMIEHVPDFVGFLGSAARLLKPGGVMSLAVPDRRYCFDYFKPPSGTGDVLEAHATRRTRHSLRSAWNHVAYAARMDGREAWGQHKVSEAGFIAEFADAAALWRDRRTGAPEVYVDCHAWQFTPAAFRLVMLELAQLGLTEWQVQSLSDAEGCEFLTVLAKGAQPIRDNEVLRLARLALLRRQLIEWREQLDHAIAGGVIPVGAAGSDARMADRLNGQEIRLNDLERRLADVQTVLGRLLGWLRPHRALARRLGIGRRTG